MFYKNVLFGRFRFIVCIIVLRKLYSVSQNVFGIGAINITTKDFMARVAL